MLVRISNYLFGGDRDRGLETRPPDLDTQIMLRTSLGDQKNNHLEMVNPFDPELTDETRVAIAMMLEKREQYVARGMFREAHGAGTMIFIMWQCCKKRRVIDTGWGEL